MTRRSTKQRGISLVEVVLTLGISSLLIATVLTGRNSIRSTAQFSDGVERVKETILSVKSDANTSNNATGTGNADSLVIGRAISFSTATSNDAQRTTLLCKATADLSCTSQLVLTDTSTVTIPWKIAYTGYTVQGSTNLVNRDVTLLFGRTDTNGSFTGAWYAGTIDANTSLSSAFANKTPITLHFESQDNRYADVLINPVTGAVTRDIK